MKISFPLWCFSVYCNPLQEKIKDISTDDLSILYFMPSHTNPGWLFDRIVELFIKWLLWEKKSIFTKKTKKLYWQNMCWVQLETLGESLHNKTSCTQEFYLKTFLNNFVKFEAELCDHCSLSVTFCSLLFACCSLLLTFCYLLFACYFLLVAHCLLLFVCYILHGARYFLLIAHICLLIAHFFLIISLNFLLQLSFLYSDSFQSIRIVLRCH